MSNITTIRKPYTLMILLVVTREARGSSGWQPSLKSVHVIKRGPWLQVTAAYLVRVIINEFSEVDPRVQSLTVSTRAMDSGHHRALWGWGNNPADMDPDSKVHGANMGPIWGRQDPGGPHVGPMNFAIWGHYTRSGSALRHDPTQGLTGKGWPLPERAAGSLELGLTPKNKGTMALIQSNAVVLPV